MRSKLLILLLCLAAGRLFAHETWLKPSAFTSAVNETVRFDLTSGMEFPALEYAIKPDRVSTARFRIGEKESDLKSSGREKKSLRFSGTFSRAGVVTVWLQLLPKELELSDEKVVEYFAEIDPSTEIREAWKQRKSGSSWKETYTKCAKTFLRVGQSQSTDESWKPPVGLPFEIVPLSDPTANHAGDTAEFQLLENDVPLSDISLGLIAEGQSERVFIKTDATGKGQFTFKTSGRVLLFAVHLQPTDDNQWRSNFTTLTMQIAP